MIHNATERNPQRDHYAVNTSGMGPYILIQIQEDGNQARIALTPKEARHLASLLIETSDRVTG